MLKLTEFVEEEVLRNSDGAVLRTLCKETYCVLYDDKIATEQEVDDFINERKKYGFTKPNPKFVLMPSSEWVKLARMIKNNYDMIERELENE